MKNLLSEIELELLTRPPGADVADAIRAITDRIITNLGITEGPVDLEMVASYCDIAEVTVDDLPAAACLITPPGGHSEIRVNRRDNRRRQRFSIGHEINHTFFPGYALQTQYRCHPSTAPATRFDTERLCDIGAASLLLPPSLLRPKVGTGPLGLSLIEDLADEFDASLAATAYNAASLSLLPTAVIMLEVAQKPTEAGTDAEPKLRVRSAMTHGDWPYVLRHKSADDDDVFDRALQGENIHETRTEVRGVFAMPVTCDVQARPCPYMAAGEWHDRVIAILVQT